MHNKQSKNSITKNIPFSCLLNASTVLTRYGNLVKTVKLSFAPFKGGDLSSLQSLLQSYIYDFDGFTFWINTLREKDEKKLSEISITDSFVSSYAKKNKNSVLKNKQFKNTVYISIVSNSILEEVGGFNDLLLLQTIKKSQKSSNLRSESLKLIAQKICSIFLKYNPKILKEKEFIDFFSLLSFDAKSDHEPSVVDIASSIASQKKNIFGFNALEIQTNEKRVFGAILKIKNCRRRSILKYFIAKVMSADFQFIISETLLPCKSDILQKRFSSLEDFSQMIDEDDLSWCSEIAEIKKKISQNKIQEFCLQTLNITIFTEKYSELTKKICQLEHIAVEYGITFSRLDLLAEDAFYSNFPGNFIFLNKQEPVLIADTCAFACTHSHFISANHKNYINCFLSTQNFLHFLSLEPEEEKSCVSIIAKDQDLGVKLQNFLILSKLAQKRDTNLMLLDSKGSSEVFIRAIGGNYLQIRAKDSNNLKINILDINDEYFLFCMLKKLCKEKSSEKIESAVKKILSIKIEDRILGNVSYIFEELEIQVEQIKQFLQTPSKFQSKMCIDFDESEDTKINSVVAFYLLFKFLDFSNLERKECIIAIEDGSRFVNLFSCEKELENFFCKVKKSNGILIFNARDIDSILNLKFNAVFKRFVKTRILVPQNGIGDLIFKDFLEIKSSDQSIIEKQIADRKCFILSQKDQVIALSFDFLDHIESEALSSKDKKESMDYATKAGGENPNLWLPIFYEQCKAKN